MSDRGNRRVAGAPFYAPPRRKTSAEIISEARAAVYGEMSGATSGAGAGGALRALRTRRPFTPRDPQRTLFTERARKKDARPPSAFDLKFLTLSETEEKIPDTSEPIDHENDLNGLLLTEEQTNLRKKPVLRNQPRSTQEHGGESWGGYAKLPHLSGRSKPLHRRNIMGHASVDETKAEFSELAQAISVIRPLEAPEIVPVSTNGVDNKYSNNSEKRKNFVATKSKSHDLGKSEIGNIAVKHIAVQLPNTTNDYERMSILELAEGLQGRDSRDVERTVLLISALQDAVEKSAPANSLRDLVLHSLYSHIDSGDERVLVAIARMMLTLRVTGPHLAAACKLVFKIARNDKNDHFFINTNLLELLVEGCGRADPVSEGECCVYGAGALRFLALEPRLSALAHAAGALHLAALHLKIINNAKAENPRGISEPTSHALYQLTGALRNLAGAGGGEREARAFVTSGALAELVTALTLHTDRDVLTNVARCLSVLSAQEPCCAWLCASTHSAGALLRALAACAARAPLAVRLAYTLGNMAAADHQARIHIYNEEGGIDVVLTILESYTKRGDQDNRNSESDPDLHLVGTDLGGSDGSNEDVLIKTVRVIANLCLAERAGRGLATTHATRVIQALLACLRVAETVNVNTIRDAEDESTSSCRERKEELATAALATLNNITFYREPPDPPDHTDGLLDQLCTVTCRWVGGCGGEGAACEAVRALGNLSRSTRTAQRLVLEGALQQLAPFLQHEESSVRCAAAGVLVNVCGSGAGVADGSAAVCARALTSAAAARDTRTAALLTRALWNAHAHNPLTPTLAHQAAVALTTFIDDESVFAACEATPTKERERRASDTVLSKHDVKFDLDNNNHTKTDKVQTRPILGRAYSMDHELHQDSGSGDETGCSGEDLGFEDGELLEDECYCDPCKRLAVWEELVGVAIPLLEKLRPNRVDASVGTE